MTQQRRQRAWMCVAAPSCGVALAVLIGATSPGLRQLEAVSSDEEALSFNRDVRPILSDKCFACHGPDSSSRQAGLRLDLRDAAIGERDGAFAIAPGDPDASEVIRRVFAEDPDERMPPHESKLSLTDAEREVLRAWVEQGATYEPHWAFVAATSPPAPEVGEAGWVRDPIDRFVLRRLESEGLRPTDEAPRERWLRRVSFDLTGLPPTLEERAGFLADDTDLAHERVVDRLLASPHFGERMAVPWLDGARYADSYGFQSDLLSPTWPWRDWVVRAFNENMPYDEFLTRQLAGDLLPDATRQDRLATSFNRLHRMTNEGGSIPEEWRVENAADRVHTFGTVFMGLTLECARCHDHKYDPISQRDYYALMAFFNSIDEHGLYERADIVPTPSVMLPTDEQEQRLAELAAEVARRETALGQAVEQSGEGFEAWVATATEIEGLADLAGRFSLDEIGEGGLLGNVADGGSGDGRINIGMSTSLPTIAEGRRGGGLRIDGDNLAHLPGINDADRWTPFTVAFWVRYPEPGPGERVIVHRSSGTDAGHYGFDLLFEEGHLTARGFRHWPGNAIAVRTDAAVLPADEWTHIVWTYDGSSRAHGFSLFVNGEVVPASAVRDRVWKTIGGGSPYGPGGTDLLLGHRFRDRGLAGAVFDEVSIVRRVVSDIEADWLYAGDDAPGLTSYPIESRVAHYAHAVDADVREARVALAEARKAMAQFENGISEVMSMEELPVPRRTDVLARGEYDAPREDATRVLRGVPRALVGEDELALADRLELSRWLTSPDHPLTARVAVNRLWQMCFGSGLVESSENFGLQGALPSHPELLDHLATSYVESGWDTKAMLKRIVLSATYRQDSAASPALREIDPTNRLLSRGPSRRLDAEMIRDLALAASGLLVAELGGPPVSPYQPAGVWREFNGFSPGYSRGSGEDLYRRSLYTVWKRTAPMPSMIALDAPGREVCVVRRAETNSPLQALVLLNDEQFVEAARVLAGRALATDGSSSERVAWMFTLVSGREPTAAELRVLETLHEEQTRVYSDDPELVTALIAVGEAPIDESMDAASVAAMSGVAQAVLSMDAAVWQR